MSIIARNSAGQPVFEKLPEGDVHRLKPWTWAPRKLSAASMFPAFFNPRWAAAITDVARRTGADLIINRDLPLAVPAIRVARRLGVPVIHDMAENYPAMMRSRWSTGRMRLLDHVVRNPNAAQRIEDWVLPRFDGTFVVVEESGQRIERKGVAPSSIAVVNNTPPHDRLEGPKAVHQAGRLEVVYLGLLELQRGVSTLIDAMALMRDRGVPARLSVFGDGLDGNLFREQARRLGLGPEQIVFHGRVPNAVGLAGLPTAHVGVVPHWADESWNTTIPNKLFDYMACGLAVLTSDAVPAARVVSTTKCGLVYHDRDPASLADALQQLADPAVRAAAAERGIAAVHETYHWERDVQRMLDLVDGVVRTRAGAEVA